MQAAGNPKVHSKTALDTYRSNESVCRQSRACHPLGLGKTLVPASCWVRKKHFDECGFRYGRTRRLAVDKVRADTQAAVPSCQSLGRS
jgi:hypothetical protein